MGALEMPRGPERSDRDLMARVQVDDAGAFEELYDRHCGLAFGIARAICGDAGEAEQAVEDGFLAVWRGRMGFREDVDTFQAWAM
jgi:RNA polymerase sigma-70 factor, ECF subfamily